MEILNLIVRIYIWGILAALLVQFIAIMLYSFGSQERSIYEANLNKVDLSWDPLKLKVYPSSQFKHTALRFWKHSFFGLLGSLLSWYEVLAKMHVIMKQREVKSMLTPEQKQAAFSLSNNPRLSKEEVIEKLKILEPDLLIREPGNIIISKEVDSKDFSRLFARAAVEEKEGKVLLGLLEASGAIITSREIAILKFLFGEEDQDFLMRTFEERRKGDVDYQETNIQNRQLEILHSIFGKEAGEEVDDEEEEDQEDGEDLGDTVNPK